MLFNNAIAHMRTDDLAAACPERLESHRLGPRVGTLLYLGEGYEEQGRIPSAWATFVESAYLSGQPKGGARGDGARRQFAQTCRVRRSSDGRAPDRRARTEPSRRILRQSRGHIQTAADANHADRARRTLL